MNKPVSLVLLIGGVFLLIYGASASDSVGSSFSRIFTGAPTDRTVWLLLGGLAATILGLFGVLRGTRSNP